MKLIDAEAAVRAVEAKRVQAYEMLEYRRQHPCIGPRQYEIDLSLITKESVLGEVVGDLRSLPAPTCATCAEWERDARYHPAGYGCCSAPSVTDLNESSRPGEPFFIGSDDGGSLYTLPTHSCAAHRPNDRSHETGGVTP